MQEEQKTKAEQVKELRQLRCRVAELEKAEDALRKSEQQFKDILENTAVGMYRTTPDGRVLMANPALVRMLGFSSFEQLSQRNLEEEGFEPCYTRSEFKERIESQGQIVGLESQWVTRDGTTLVVIESARVVRDESGRILYYEGTAEDITERKNAEEMLNLERDNLTNILDSMEDGIYIVNQNHDIQYVNPALRKDFGPFEGRKCYEYFHDRKEICPWCKNQDVFAGRPVRWEWYSHKNQRTYDLIDTPLKNPDGSISKLEIFRDITERKKAEEEKEKLLGDLNERIKELDCLYRLSKLVEKPDISLENVFQGAANLIPPAWQYPDTTCARISFEDKEFKTDNFKTSKWRQSEDIKVRGKKVGSIEVYYLLEKPEIEQGPFSREERELLHAIAERLGRITERGQAEQRIRELNEELEQRVRERTAELTKAHKKLLQDIDERRRMEKDILDISEREQRRIGQELHDSLGQQLTGIAIMSKVLEQKLKGKSIEESAEAQEIGRLLNQSAEQTRKLAKGLHPVDLDASGLMSALQELAMTTEQLFGIHCTFDYDEPVPVGYAAVAVHLYRIAQEAVTNAIKHGKAANIVVRLAPNRDMLILTIESDGLDFPEVPPKNKGMGLHIMKYRAEMIDGTLDVHRGIKGGTIVTCAFTSQRSDENERQNHGREKTAG